MLKPKVSISPGLGMVVGRDTKTELPQLIRAIKLISEGTLLDSVMKELVMRTE